MSKPKIILIGGGAHCKVIVSILKKLNEFDIYGISDVKENLGKQILEVTINTTDDKLEEVLKLGVKYCFISLGSIGNPSNRIKLLKKIKNIGFKLPTIISKDAIIDENVTIGEGTVVMPGAVINVGTIIGKNCIINTGAVIDHDCIIKDNIHIAPGVSISGGVSIGYNSHVGTGVSIIQGINIGDNVLIGAGAVVVNDIINNSRAIGVPAKAVAENII